MKIVGITGYAGSGKDTAAAGLIADGWTRIAFADRLKKLATDIGWNGEKDEAGRKLLQALGHQARVHLGWNVWVEAAAQDIFEAFKGGAPGVVVTDVRYWNEADWIGQHGGHVIRIDRPGVEPANNHAGELAVDKIVPHATLVNNGSPEDIQKQVGTILKYWGIE